MDFSPDAAPDVEPPACRLDRPILWSDRKQTRLAMRPIRTSQVRWHPPHSVARDESLIITRHRRRFARRVPLLCDLKCPQQAAARTFEHLQYLKRAPLGKMIATIHEAQRYQPPVGTARIPRTRSLP